MRVENSVSSVTVWHHEACRVIPNSYLERWNFHSAPHNHCGFFFLHTLLSTVALSLTMHYFINSMLKYHNLPSVWLLSTMLMSKHLAENDVKKLVSKRRPDVTNEWSYTTLFPPTCVKLDFLILYREISRRKS